LPDLAKSVHRGKKSSPVKPVKVVVLSSEKVRTIWPRAIFGFQINEKLEISFSAILKPSEPPEPRLSAR
jgi:hypothetical protein